MAEHFNFWKFARIQTDREYQRTGFYNGYWERGFFENQLIINAVIGVLWLIISVAGTSALLSLFYRMFPVYQMLQDNEYQNNIGTISFLKNTLQLLSVYIVPQVLTPFLMKGFRMLTAFRQGSTTFTQSKPDYSYETFYVRYVSEKFDRFFLAEKRTPTIEKVAGNLGFVYLRRTHGLLIFFAALAMSYGIYGWSVSDEISGIDIYAGVLFWCGLGGFAAAYGLSHLIAYLYWRGRANKIMAAEAEARTEAATDGVYTSGSTSE